MAQILKLIISSGSKKKEPRNVCLSETNISHSYKMWSEISSSVPNFLQVMLLHNPITYGCLLRVLCLVGRPLTTLDCVLFMDSNWASVAGLVPEINYWAWNSYLLNGIMYRSLMPKFTSNVESTDGNFYMPQNKVWFFTVPVFTELTASK